MKKFLKSRICRFVNSAWMHYSQLTWSNSVAGTKRKEKKKSENANVATYNSNSNIHIILLANPCYARESTYFEID